MKIAIDTLYAGTPRSLGQQGAQSAIFKVAVEAPWVITRTGLTRDEQADKVHHGGSEKALHHYARDHYVTWASEIPEIASLLSSAPAFGENISTVGITEADVCIGDVLRAGTAVLQISQGRQPCWKLNAKFDRSDMAYRLQNTGRTGWYYRVIEEGEINPGDELVLADRPQSDWPVARVLELLYQRTMDLDSLSRLSQVTELAQGWRTLAANRVKTRSVESWSSRLTGKT